jgi:hypothetical protein
MEREPALRALRGRAALVLDTTYCAPQYAFPPQLQARACLLASQPATLA